MANISDERARRDYLKGHGLSESFREELEMLEQSGFRLEPPSEEFVKATAEAAREVLNEQNKHPSAWENLWERIRSFLDSMFNWRN